MPSSGMACLISATRRGGVMGNAQSSVPHVRCLAICLAMYAKYLCSMHAGDHDIECASHRRALWEA